MRRSRKNRRWRYYDEQREREDARALTDMPVHSSWMAEVTKAEDRAAAKHFVLGEHDECHADMPCRLNSGGPRGSDRPDPIWGDSLMGRPDHPEHGGRPSNPWRTYRTLRGWWALSVGRTPGGLWLQVGRRVFTTEPGD